ncbi:MAG: DUF2812 domain-containing protein [Oscillospiraceae bacterium]|nr:DUF2812 domain-containing protein [Oscillospiraceae bacterium]
MREKTRKRVLPPCPPYDVEGTESWLTDLASEGWLLAEDGFFFGIASFEKGEPAHICYRLEAAPRQANAWDDNGGMPDGEAVELNAQFGWEYVSRRGQFYIYRNGADAAREIHTDPQVQALAVREVYRRQIRYVLLTAFWWIAYPLSLLGRGFSYSLAAAEMGLLFALSCVIFPIWLLISGTASVRYLGRLKRKLQAGEPLDHEKQWKKSRTRYYLSGLLTVIPAVLLIILVVRAANVLTSHSDRMPRADYSGEIPFATISDFAEGTYEQTWNDLGNDYIAPWSNVFLRQGIHWEEHARVCRPDGTFLDGGLSVDYYETGSEWFAKNLAAELRRVDRTRARGSYERLECPDFGLDEAAAYRNLVHIPCVVLRRGNRVIHAYFYQTGDQEKIPLEEWAGKLAESIS